MSEFSRESSVDSVRIITQPVSVLDDAQCRRRLRDAQDKDGKMSDKIAILHAATELAAITKKKIRAAAEMRLREQSEIRMSATAIKLIFHVLDQKMETMVLDPNPKLLVQDDAMKQLMLALRRIDHPMVLPGGMLALVLKEGEDEDKFIKRMKDNVASAAKIAEAVSMMADIEIDIQAYKAVQRMRGTKSDEEAVDNFGM